MDKAWSGFICGCDLVHNDLFVIDTTAGFMGILACHLMDNDLVASTTRVIYRACWKIDIPIQTDKAKGSYNREAT